MDTSQCRERALAPRPRVGHRIRCAGPRHLRRILPDEHVSPTRMSPKRVGGRMMAESVPRTDVSSEHVKTVWISLAAGLCRGRTQVACALVAELRAQAPIYGPVPRRCGVGRRNETTATVTEACTLRLVPHRPRGSGWRPSLDSRPVLHSAAEQQASPLTPRRADADFLVLCACTRALVWLNNSSPPSPLGPRQPDRCPCPLSSAQSGSMGRCPQIGHGQVGAGPSGPNL